MRFPFFQVDAFTRRAFSGNPAAVCLLESWPDDALLQALAAENNLSETAYLVPEGADWRLRWFTPTTEVDLCGHATLAAAQVLAETQAGDATQWQFLTRSGRLTCTAEGDAWCLTLPVLRLTPGEVPDLPGVPVLEAFVGMDTVLVLADADAVRGFDPEWARHPAFAGVRGLCVTAQGDAPGVDFVSRFFAPNAGIAEDPVTGSAHCALAPYWATRLGRKRLRARQLSARGGDVDCEVDGQTVRLRGHAVTVIRGTVTLDRWN